MPHQIGIIPFCIPQPHTHGNISQGGQLNCAIALIDHNKVLHDALGIDADTVDGEHAANIVTKARVNPFLTPPNDCWFRAYRATSAQTVNAGNTDKILWNAENYDHGSHFDLANSKFVAPVDGYYFFVAAIYTDMANGKQGSIFLKKNGTEIARGRSVPAGDANFLTMRVATDVYLTSGDEITVWFWNGDTVARDIVNLDYNSYFCGRQFA